MKLRGRRKTKLVLSEQDLEVLERLARRPRTARNIAFRARVVLLCAQGLSNGAVAKSLRTHRQTVARWRERFVKKGSDGLQLSTDPLLVDKVRDIVGLYMNPPVHALVLCVDEKSQIQALNRSQPIFPMRPGEAERRTHDYERNGTTSLFAALDIATGTVIGKCYERHRSREFRKFLDVIDDSVPPGLDIHIVLDNYNTHKTPKDRRY